MGGCCRPTTRFGACLCALIRSIPYISLAGFGCMVMGFLLITANLVPLFDFIRDHILDPEQPTSYSRRVMNGAYTYYWIVSFIALSGCLFSLFLSLFGTGWIHEQCCGIKRSLGKGPSVCLNFVSSTFMVLQAVMVIFFFLLTLLAVLSFTLSVVFAGSREGVRNICNIRPVQIYNRAANITVCTQVYEEYYRINATDTHTPTEGSITPNITRLDKQLQDETYYNSTCINLKQYNQDLVDIKCGAPYDKFCASATTTKLRTAAGALVAGTSFFLMSCLLFLASTPANYVRFRQLPEYRILNTNDGGGRRGGAGAQRLEDEEEDWSEDVDDEEDASPKGRGRGGRAGGRRGGTGGRGRGRRQQAGGQFSVQDDDDDDDDVEMDDAHGHGAVPVTTLPPGAHAVVVAAAEEETARLRRAREALEAEAEAVRKRRHERELEDERERTAERERRRVREEAETNERMERMRRQLDDEKRQLEAERVALRQQQATVQSAVASQAQAQQQATLNKAAGSTESATDTTTSPADNSVSAM